MLAPELAALIETERRDVLSVALDVDPAKPEHQSEPPAWRIWLRNELRSLLDRLPASDRRAAEAPAARILSFSEHDRPAGKGLAVFAAPDLWHVAVLPVPLHNRVRYGRPDLLPLLWAAEEYRPYAVLAVSKESVRLLVADLGGTTVAQAEALELDTSEWRFKAGRQPSFTRRTGTGAARGTQRDTFEARVDEHRRRLWQGAAEAAARWLQETGIERLIIAGPEEAASAVRSLLPPSALARVVAVVPVASDLDPEAIHRATIPVALREERAGEQALVDDIVTRAGTAGTVVGVGPTLDAVARENVLTLAADREVEAEVEACTRCGHVSAGPAGACPICGGPVERAALSQLLPLLARRSGARLEMVGGEAAARLRAHGGVGAVLRYTV